MKNKRQHGEELFSQHFRQIEGIVRGVAAQHRLSADDRQELHSLVMLKVARDDFAILRRFQGKSRWSTYLTVITQRLLLDRRVKEWGRWRPCALARRLGPMAVELDRRINRDGLEAAEAVRELSSRGLLETTAELERLAELIPRRPRRRFLHGDKHLKILVDREQADRRVVAAERRRAAGDLKSALAGALRDLPSHERDLLGLRFGRGWTVRRIAASRNLEERPLYRRFEHILRRLRRRLEGVGLCWKHVAVALDGPEVDLELGLR